MLKAICENSECSQFDITLQSLSEIPYLEIGYPCPVCEEPYRLEQITVSDSLE